MAKIHDPIKNSTITANNIIIGKNFSFGSNVNINIRGDLIIGDNSRFGNDVDINAEELKIGSDFIHLTPGLKVGGGGSQFEFASLEIGDRCVLHNNYINIARKVTLGNDVGISPDSDILTHGFWNSILEGFPVKYGEVLIKSGTIIGQRSFILPGVTIENNVVVGANSTVTKSLTKPNSVYAGNPAKFIKDVVPPSIEQQHVIMAQIIQDYIDIVNKKKQFSYTKFEYNFPVVQINNAIINVVTRTLIGEEDECTDRFRDFIRRYGIKIYTGRPFLSL